MISELIEKANAGEGSSSVAGAHRECPDQQAARRLFAAVRTSMFAIREWGKMSGVTGYALFDEHGRERNNEPIEEGSFIRISLVGSGKYDWVRVVRVLDAEREVVITVKPTFDPTQKQDRDGTSHFFESAAENNFCLQLRDSTVSFFVIGLNEKTNAEETDGVVESIRNAAVANIGYYTGAQQQVWNSFCESFLESGVGSDEE